MEDGAWGSHQPSEWAKRGPGTPAVLHILFPPTSGGGTYHRLHLPKGGPLFSLPRVRLEGASGVDRFEMRSWITQRSEACSGHFSSSAPPPAPRPQRSHKEQSRTFHFKGRAGRGRPGRAEAGLPCQSPGAGPTRGRQSSERLRAASAGETVLGPGGRGTCPAAT